MANLSLTVDFGLNRLAEPGFHQTFASRDLVEQAVPGNAESRRGFWRDPEFYTLMLMPLQFRDDWLDTAAQLPHLIQLAAMNANASDLTANRIFEANLFGNANTPWIHHAPASPTALSPLTGLSSVIDLAPIEPLSEATLSITGSGPGIAPGAASDGRFIVGTVDDLPANQPLYVRFYWPENKPGHQVVYAFVWAQFALLVRGGLVELFVDPTPGGTQNDWVKVMDRNLFVPQGIGSRRNQDAFGQIQPVESRPEYRSLFILPFRRNRLLIMSNLGLWMIYRVSHNPNFNRRLPDDSDWDITRAGKLAVWALNPSPGHFQIHKVAWKKGPVVIHLPHVQLDYTPGAGNDPTAALDVDTDHGTTIVPTVEKPPTYPSPTSSLDKCTTPTTDPSAAGQRYGVKLTFDNPADQRFTPFFYALTLTAPRAFLPTLTTAQTMLDTQSVSTRIQRATVTVGERPGESKLEATVLDFNPFAFAPYYYRMGYELRLADFTAPSTFSPLHFVGLAEPHEVVPWRFDTAVPRGVTIIAADLWKALADAYLRSQRNFGAVPGERRGWGHITAVKFLAEQAGIDLTGADTPAESGAAHMNWELGGIETEVDQISHELNPGWQPKLGDTSASMIERIATLFSGWIFGFHQDGQFYYHPRDFYLASGTPAAIFYPDEATRTVQHVGGLAGLPSGLFRDPVEFRTLEPQANVIQVVAGRDTDGEELHSPAIVDYASILNPSVVNFIGRWKAAVITLGGVFSCAELTRMARIVWDEARRRKRRVQFRGDYLPGLKVARRVRLFGYGDYRLAAYSADFESRNWHDAVYEAEFIERGYGLA